MSRKVNLHNMMENITFWNLAVGQFAMPKTQRSLPHSVAFLVQNGNRLAVS
jgi:hypothetical protein